MIQDLRETKRTLRKRVLAERDALSPAVRSRASQSICESILAMPQFDHASTILAYVGFGSELDTAPVTTRVLASGKALILPRVDRERRALVLYRVDDFGESLIEGTWGIREPDPTHCSVVDPNTIEFVLVPGVAFSRACARLGYGAGYYDRLIPTLGKRPPLVAGAYSLQVLDDVPAGPADVAIDCVVTERDTFRRLEREQRE